MSAELKPWRAEVVGSLLRPADLVNARKRLDSGEMTSAEFKAVEDAVKSVNAGALAGLDAAAQRAFVAALATVAHALESHDADAVSQFSPAERRRRARTAKS